MAQADNEIFLKCKKSLGGDGMADAEIARLLKTVSVSAIQKDQRLFQQMQIALSSRVPVEIAFEAEKKKTGRCRPSAGYGKSAAQLAAQQAEQLKRPLATENASENLPPNKIGSEDQMVEP